MALNLHAIRAATRQQKFLKLLISGSTGTGKTFGSLLIAKGLTKNGRVLALDTENGRMDLKEGHPLFGGWGWERLVTDPDAVTSADYTDFLKYAVKEKYDAVILDSITHEWEYILNQWGKLGGKWGVAYNKAFEPHKAFVKSLLNSNIHIICTARAEMATEQQTNAEGKKEVVTLGLKEQQHKNLSYEFDFHLRILDREHNCSAEKSEGGLFEDIFTVTEKTGEQLMDFLSVGESLEDVKKRDCLSRINALHDQLVGLGLRTEPEIDRQRENLKKVDLADILDYGKQIKAEIDAAIVEEV